MVRIGETVRDKVTDFTGVATGRVEYISGCVQFLVAPKVGADGRLLDAVWFDEQRLEIAGCDRIVLDNSKTPGCDRQAPKR